MLYIIVVGNQSLSTNGKTDRKTGNAAADSLLSLIICSAIKIKNLDYYREENSFYMKSCVFLKLSFLS